MKNIDKKKLVRRLQIIGMFSLILVGIITVTRNGKAPSGMFIFECTFPILIILGIPAFERPYIMSGTEKKK